jgi:uncharacterized protein (TIGR00290 family)
VADERTILSWSSGKDSAWTLHRLRQSPDSQVAALITTFNDAMNRVAMHAVRRELVRAQAKAVGLPLVEVGLPWPCSNEDYERIFGAALTAAASRFDARQVAFGDLFLEDIRAYRVAQLQRVGLQPCFPLWQIPTTALSHEMIAAGLKAELTCVDPRQLNPKYVGRSFDARLLEALPDNVDPCGENGEFHTFAWDGPMFATPVPVQLGKKVERDGFWFADISPATATRTAP